MQFRKLDYNEQNTARSMLTRGTRPDKIIFHSRQIQTCPTTADETIPYPHPISENTSANGCSRNFELFSFFRVFINNSLDASRFSAGFRAKKPSVDPTRPYKCFRQIYWHRKQTGTHSIPSALSVVRDNECKIIVNEKNAVQFCGSDARSFAVGNYSYCTDHKLHRDRSCAHSKIYSCDYTEYWERRLMLFPGRLRISPEPSATGNDRFQWLLHRLLTGASLQSVPVAVVCA